MKVLELTCICLFRKIDLRIHEVIWEVISLDTKLTSFCDCHGAIGFQEKGNWDLGFQVKGAKVTWLVEGFRFVEFLRVNVEKEKHFQSFRSFLFFWLQLFYVFDEFD